jgi:hypothetical protein
VVGNVGEPIGAASKVASTFANLFGLGARKHYTAPMKRKPKPQLHDERLEKVFWVI